MAVDDGREAASYLQSQKFDGVIVDAHMPYVDGFELTRCVKASPLNAAIPIVMLTREDDIDTMRKGFKAGVTFFAVKPTSRERACRLFNAVRGAMESEKRRHLRLPYRTTVTCTLGDPSERRFVAESLEIGEGGIALRPSGGVEVGRELVLEFLLPQVLRSTKSETRRHPGSLFTESEASPSGPQRVRAKVCYRAPGDSIGLEFIGLAPAQRGVIQHYISGAL